MDVLAHTLWTNAVFHTKYHKDRKNRYWAAFFGVLPDLVSFVPTFIYLAFTRNFTSFRDVSSQHWVLNFAKESYNYTHSLVIFLAVFLVVLIFRKGKVYWPLLGWALHVLIDIPSHRGFYETPFLFPISNYRFSHGMSWGRPVFMIVNYTLLVSVYVFLFLYEKRKQKT